MTNSLRDARVCLVLATSSAATGVYFAVHASWWCVPGFYCAAFLGWCERRLRADHRRRLWQEEWERRRRVPGERPGPLIPCCRLALHSEGAAHDRWCVDGPRRAPGGG
ncbi:MULTISPECIES: hypothetical protein [unclassified Streptomyces]|uniref:hypothetical protein n=1 Tax=unclassified Streptomyces TaxID=2593676 RepID=UPI0036FA39BB